MKSNPPPNEPKGKCRTGHRVKPRCVSHRCKNYEPPAFVLLREYIDAQISYRLTGYKQVTLVSLEAQQVAERVWEAFVAALEVEDETK